jgi:hypothetical protein
MWAKVGWFEAPLEARHRRAASGSVAGGFDHGAGEVTYRNLSNDRHLAPMNFGMPGVPEPACAMT